MSANSGKQGRTRKYSTALARMKQDYMRLKRDPLPYVTAEPLPNNMLEWHYVVKGPEDSPYFGGYYHGTLLFPREFPFKPPSIYMFTPNGRFKTNTRLCLSISGKDITLLTLNHLSMILQTVMFLNMMQIFILTPGIRHGPWARYSPVC